jgi:glycosyltransferase involved in cell wall biosynthesis
LVSVLIPTFNRAYTIRRAIESVLAQTYPAIEVLVVDDGSTDETAELIAGYGPKVRYFYQTNAGVSAARNRGLVESRGEFVALLDSDDAWLPWKVEAQLAVLRAFPEVGMVWTDMKAIDADGKERDPRYLRKFYDAYSKVNLEVVCRARGHLVDLWPQASADIAGSSILVGQIYNEMFLGNLIHTSTVMLTRQRLTQVGFFDTSLGRAGEDYEFHTRTSMHGDVALLDHPSILYRIGGDDQLTRPDRQVMIARNNLIVVLRWLEADAGRFTFSETIVNQRLADSYRWLGEAELDLGRNRQAARHLWRSFIYHPCPRVASRLMLCALPPDILRATRRLRRALRRVTRESKS